MDVKRGIEKAVDALTAELKEGPVGAPLNSPRYRRLAIVSLVLWSAAITAGRLMAYL
jgi:hypothetical protein